MKFVFLFVGLIWLDSVAQAQVLPIPGNQNPDWILEKTEYNVYSQQLRPPFEKGSQLLGNTSAHANAVDRMPNSFPKSIRSIGNRHSYWDAERQVSYEWVSRSGGLAPDDLVILREEQTGNIYTYRQKVASKAVPRPWRSLTPNKK